MVVNLIISIIGILLICLSYLFIKVTMLRLSIIILGLLILSIGICLKKTNVIKSSSISFIVLLIISVFVDSFISISFNTIPVYSKKIDIDENSYVYNAIGYRIWDCNKKDKVVDKFYKMGFYCEVSDKETLNVNAFLSEIVDKFSSYKNTYIKLNGKISRKEGANSIEMQMYQSNGITLNGYALFSDDVTLNAEFNKDSDKLNGYDIYDNVTIIGKISRIKEKDGQYIVYMKDTKVIEEVNYDKFDIVINKKQNCEYDKNLIYSSIDYSVYTSCIDNVLVKFDNNNVYELSSALSSSKIDIDKLLSKSKEESIDEITKEKVYEYDDYKILKCGQTKELIIGTNSVEHLRKYCGEIIDEEE